MAKIVAFFVLLASSLVWAQYCPPNTYWYDGDCLDCTTVESCCPYDGRCYISEECGQFVDAVCILCDACGNTTYSSTETCGPDTVCLDCVADCNDCTGPTISDCSACVTGMIIEGEACVACDTCTSTQYRTGTCTGSDPYVCHDCTATCPSGQFKWRECGGPLSDVDAACTTCRTCGNGFFTNGGCSGSTDTICSACSASCGVCTNNTYAGCTTCKTGFYHGASSCLSCAVCGSGYYVASACSDSANTVCTACIDHCATCTGTTFATCSACAVGYYLDSVSQSCVACVDSDCAACTGTSANTCSACLPGHWLNTTTHTCTVCATCSAGLYRSTNCGTNQETVCTACKNSCVNSGQAIFGQCLDQDTTCEICSTAYAWSCVGPNYVKPWVQAALGSNWTPTCNTAYYSSSVWCDRYANFQANSGLYGWL